MKRLLPISILPVILSACNTNTSKKSDKAADLSLSADKRKDSIKNQLESEYLNTVKTLKGAEIEETMIIVDSIKFSKFNQKDRFELTVNKGKISETKSFIKIFRDSSLIYADTLNSWYFVKYIFEPDTIPKNVTQEEFNDYIRSYGSSLKKGEFEKYARETARGIFDGVLVSPEELKTANKFGTINDSFLLELVLKDTNLRVITFPLFNRDFGRSYLAYSEKEKRAIKILESD